MYNFLSKNGQFLGFGLGLLFVVIFLISVFSGLEGFNSLATPEEQYTTGIFNAGIYGAIILIVIAAVAAILFSVFNIFSDLKGSLKGLIGIGVLLVIFFVLYSMSSGTAEGIVKKAVDSFHNNNPGATITEGILKFISGGIGLAVLLSLLGLLVAAVSEIRNAFK